jgi:hypothetical protein
MVLVVGVWVRLGVGGSRGGWRILGKVGGRWVRKELIERVGWWMCVGGGRGRRGVGLASWEAVSGGRVDGAEGEGRVSSLDDDEVNHFGFGAGLGYLIA